MPQTAIISPQIIDSTATGRDLITAADAAAGRAVLDIEGGSYTWTGDHTFEGNVVTATGGSSTQYNLGAAGDANTEYVQKYWDTNIYRIKNFQTGTGSLRSIAVESNDGTGLFVTPFDVRIRRANNDRVIFENNAMRPAVDNFVSSGTDSLRWSNNYSVDGSFSGNLISETGGSYKLYNLGTEGDADTEYLETSVDTNKYVIAPKKTGAGAVRQFELEGCYGANFGNIFFDTFGFLNLRYGQSPTAHISLRSTGTELAKDIFPNIAALDVLSLGKSTARFGEFYSVDGDFSGTTTTAGFKTAIAGTLATSIALGSTDHTVICDCQLNNITVQLPDASTNEGRIYVIKKVDSTSNFVTVFPSGTDTIDGGSLHVINTTNECIHVQALGTGWFII